MLSAHAAHPRAYPMLEKAQLLGVARWQGNLALLALQLALLPSDQGGVSSWLAAPTARVFDEAEIRKRAKAKRATGRPRGGFKAN